MRWDERNCCMVQCFLTRFLTCFHGNNHTKGKYALIANLGYVMNNNKKKKSRDFRVLALTFKSHMTLGKSPPFSGPVTSDDIRRLPAQCMGWAWPGPKDCTERPQVSSEPDSPWDVLMLKWEGRGNNPQFCLRFPLAVPHLWAKCSRMLFLKGDEIWL